MVSSTATKNKTGKAAPVKASGFDRFFEITHRKSSPSREVRGGLVTFFTMAYILALNPIIIGTGPDSTGRLITGACVNIPDTAVKGACTTADLVADIGAATGTSIAAVAAATALVAGLMTLLMGFLGRYPVGIATGLGINAMVAYTIVKMPGMTWPDAMGLIVWEGIVITVLVLTGFRQAIFKAVPKELRIAISVGIGLFIAFIGLVDAGIIRADGGTITSLGIGGSLLGWPVLIFVVGLFLMIFLYSRKVKGGILIAILGMTVIAVILQLIHAVPAAHDETGAVVAATGWWSNVPSWTGGFTWPSFQLLFHVNMFGGFAPGGSLTFGSLLTGVMLLLSLVLSDFFDTMGTIVAIGAEGDLLNEKGEPPHLREVLLADALAAVGGGLGGVSSNTAYIESSAGVAEGARTGFASVITGAAFLVAIFVSPVMKLVPAEAVATALVLVGFLMLQQVKNIPWDDIEKALPAFLAILFMPLGYSITVGIGVGFISYVLLKIFHKKIREIHPLMWVCAALFVVYFLQGLVIG